MKAICGPLYSARVRGCPGQDGVHCATDGVGRRLRIASVHQMILGHGATRRLLARKLVHEEIRARSSPTRTRLGLATECRHPFRCSASITRAPHRRDMHVHYERLPLGAIQHATVLRTSNLAAFPRFDQQSLTPVLLIDRVLFGRGKIRHLSRRPMDALHRKSSWSRHGRLISNHL